MKSTTLFKDLSLFGNRTIIRLKKIFLHRIVSRNLSSLHIKGKKGNKMFRIKYIISNDK